MWIGFSAWCWIPNGILTFGVNKVDPKNTIKYTGTVTVCFSDPKVFQEDPKYRGSPAARSGFVRFGLCWDPERAQS